MGLTQEQPPAPITDCLLPIAYCPFFSSVFAFGGQGMLRFSSDDVEIAFVDEGNGDPILLIHGFASNLGVNWRVTGWIDTLKRDGRRVIAFDVRGHGESGKLYTEADYRIGRMSQDARNLIDHLGLERVDVM